MATVIVHDHSALVIAKLIKARKRALTAVGIKVQAEATKNATPSVDTGRLRASLSYVVEDGMIIKPNLSVVNSESEDTQISGAKKAVVIGTNVEYAKYIEYGGSQKQPRGYLRIAVDENRNIITNILNQEYKKALK